MSASITYNAVAYDRSFVSTIRIRFQRARPVVMVAAAVAVAGYSLFLSQTNGEFAAVILAVLLASTVSSIAGFAFSAICGVMLLQLMTDPVAAVRVMMVCSIAIQSLSVALLWRSIEWRLLARYVLGGVVGLPFGLWLLTHLSHTVSREAIGSLLIGYAIYALLKRPVTFTRGGLLADAVIGFAGGVTGGLAAFPGAFVTIWVGMKGWDKRRQRSVFQPYILIMQILAPRVDAVDPRLYRRRRSGFPPVVAGAGRPARHVVRIGSVRTVVRQEFHARGQRTAAGFGDRLAGLIRGADTR